ncbi:conserved hypothetical protein [Ricinus communis]|uniref:Uncharacterized protein n=1 Tax=Ricinus communis TaxID=3988 RepID=B9SJZ7_RICCO|nr:conserved hypothetical protein [Ricinus communis]
MTIGSVPMVETIARFSPPYSAVCQPFWVKPVVTESWQRREVLLAGVLWPTVAGVGTVEERERRQRVHQGERG